MKPQFKNIAKLVKEKRELSGYSQNELSRHLGYLNGQFISNVERSLCSYPLKDIPHLMRILNITHEEMFETLMADAEYKITSVIGSRRRK